MAHEFGVRLALIAFATAAMRGLFTGNDFTPTVQAALLIAGLFYVLGVVCGEMARRLVEEHVQLKHAQGMNRQDAENAKT